MIREKTILGVKLLGLLPAALGCFVALSFMVSVYLPFAKITSGEGSAGWVASLSYLLGVGIAGWLLKRTDGWPEHVVVWGLVGLGFVAKALVVWIVPQLPFNTDQALLHHFATRLAADGYKETTLAALSRFYDYPLWTNRIYPIHYLIARLAPQQALAWTKALNVLAATLILVLTYGVARRVVFPGKRKWAVFLMLVLPFQTFWVTDYSHHLYSSLYLLAFAWAAGELALGEPRLWQRLGFSSLATICLLLLAWQVGVDWIAIGMAVGLVIVYAIISSDSRKTVSLALFLLVIPVAVSSALKGPLLLDRLRACDTHRQNSVLAAFMARGWNPETGGEYCARYEQLDMVTPRSKKAGAMFRLVLSQMRHAPVKTCIGLPCIKTAKLFLVGYASNLEESLSAVHSPALPWVSWVRRCGTAVFLGFVLLGCIRITGIREIPVAWIPVLLVPLLTWGAYVLAGETSPRYSVFCQSFLAVVGACAVRDGADAKSPVFSVQTWLYRTLAVFMLLLIVAGTMSLAVRLVPLHAVYVNLLEGGDGSSTRQGPFPLFERCAVLQPGEECVAMDWQVPKEVKRCSFYALQFNGAMAQAKVIVESADGAVLTTVPLDGHTLPEYVEVSLPLNTRELRVRVSRSSTDTGQEGTFVFGYLLWSMS